MGVCVVPALLLEYFSDTHYICLLMDYQSWYNGAHIVKRQKCWWFFFSWLSGTSITCMPSILSFCMTLQKILSMIYVLCCFFPSFSNFLNEKQDTHKNLPVKVLPYWYITVVGMHALDTKSFVLEKLWQLSSISSNTNQWQRTIWGKCSACFLGGNFW